jgi:peptide methionine sulfoxide reductase MsrA
MQQIDSSTAVWISFLLCQPHSFQLSFKDKGRQYKPLQFVGGQDKTRQDNTTQHNTTQENTIQDKAGQDKIFYLYFF